MEDDLHRRLEELEREKQELLKRLQAAGGAAVSGDVNTQGGDFVGRDKIIQGIFNQSVSFQVSAGQLVVQLSGGQQAMLAQDEAAQVFLQAYYQALAERCRDLPLSRVYRQYDERARKQKVSLETVYTDLEVVRPVLDRAMDVRRLGKRLERAEEGDREALIQVIADHKIRRFVLLGGAGSGKTTFVNYLTFALARAAAGQAAPGLPAELAQALPVRIVLRHVVKGIPEDAPRGCAGMLWQVLRAEIVEWFGEEVAGLLFPVLQRRLLADGCVALLDGLDEVPEAGQKRAHLIEAIQDWLKCFRKPPRVLLTARPYAYANPAWQMDEVEVLSLAPFGERQVEKFIDHWYKAVGPMMGWDAETAQGRGNLLKQEMRNRPYLADLATRPLLLTLTAAVDSSGGKLPEDRSDLYEEAVVLLLTRWQSAREALDGRGQPLTDADVARVRNIPEDQKRRAIEKLAYRVHLTQGRLDDRQREAADISLGEIVGVFSPLLPEDINPGVLVRFLEQRAGLLVGQSEEVYTFLHRSFQEYLAGCYLLGQDDFAGQMKRLLENDRDWWREVYLLAVGRARSSGPGYVGYVLDQFVPGSPEECVDKTETHWRLAVVSGQALLELGVNRRGWESEKMRILQRRVSGWLRQLVSGGHLAVRERIEAGDVLGQLGDPRFRADAWYLPDEPLLGFVPIPAGKFWMGSDPRVERCAKEHETPQHELDLPEYWMGRYPVTVAQFRAFVEDYHYKSVSPNSLSGLPHYPVGGVTWYEALDYCRWLTAKMKTWAGTPARLKELLSAGWQVLLPSEAQWEKAARGYDGRIYPWGNEPDPDRANTKENGVGETCVVGCFPGGASPYGLLDMIGNVWEWTLSLGKPYPYSLTEAREDLNNKDLRRVLRGGSFYGDQSFVRCACRSWFAPPGRDGYGGFRVALRPPDDLVH